MSNGPLTGRREVAVMDLARESEMRTLAFSFSFFFFLCYWNRGLIHCAAILMFAKENNNNECRGDEFLFSFFLSFVFLGTIRVVC